MGVNPRHALSQPASVRKQVSIIAHGVAIATSGAAANSAIPLTSFGEQPERVRVAATADAYVRFGSDTDKSAVIAAAGTGHNPQDLITLAGGTFTDAMVLEVATVKVISAALLAIGSGFAKDDVITAAGGTATTKATFTVATTQLASMTSNAAGTAYVPGQTLTTAGTGATASAHATLTVTHTKAVSATVAAGGSGDLGDGAGVIVEGTTGTGTKFRASVTIATNAVASVQSISLAGDYTANPTTIATEPVTYISGASSGSTLTGAQLNVVMGMLTATILTAGNYTVNATALTQNGATAPAGGTGATWSSPLFGVRTFTVSQAGSYTVNSASFTQFGAAVPPGGTGFTADTVVWGVNTVTVSTPGDYSVEPANPVAQDTTTGVGVNATFTLTWGVAAASGDMLVTPYEAVIVDVLGYETASAIQLDSAGVVQISPIEN